MADQRPVLTPADASASPIRPAGGGCAAGIGDPDMAHLRFFGRVDDGKDDRTGADL
jgi:hypothetical protein